jgi:transposase-like protein
MVEKHGNIMALVDIFAHLYILRRKRRGIQPRGIKAKVALETMKGDQTLVELAERFQIHPNLITEWKKVLLERAPEVFDKGKPSREPDVKELHAKIGQLAMENDFLSVALGRIDGCHRGILSPLIFSRTEPR